jgi:hypothetical protein
MVFTAINMLLTLLALVIVIAANVFIAALLTVSHTAGVQQLGWPGFFTGPKTTNTVIQE